MYTEKHVLVQKKIKKCLQVGLPLWAWVKKTDQGVETQGLSSKEKVSGAVVSKEGHPDNLLGHERTQHYLFPGEQCNGKQCFWLQIP